MKISKSRLKDLRELCGRRRLLPDDDQIAGRWFAAMVPDEIEVLIKEVLKHRKLRKKLRPLRDACDSLMGYVKDGDSDGLPFSSDRLNKYEHEVQERAIDFALGKKYWDGVAVKLDAL